MSSPTIQQIFVYAGKAVGFAYVFAFSPLLAYLSAVTHATAICGFGVGLWLRNQKLIVVRNACLWGALIGFTLGFLLDLVSGRYPAGPNTSATFVVLVFFLSVARVAVEAALELDRELRDRQACRPESHAAAESTRQLGGGGRRGTSWPPK